MQYDPNILWIPSLNVDYPSFLDLKLITPNNEHSY